MNLKGIRVRLTQHESMDTTQKSQRAKAPLAGIQYESGRTPE
jgi:hypothetical protein